MIIQVNNLTQRFGENTALDHVSFTASRGEVLVLLGPNGAGKTTTVRLLNGLFRPAEGTISILGHDPVKDGQYVRERTGVLTETPALYERLTAVQNLEFFGSMAGLKPVELRERIDELLTFFDLQDRSAERVGGFSKGMKQRLAIARAVLHRPEILFLDEPTSGLDPEAARQVREYITAVKETGEQTLVICTHNLYEAERLSDQILVLNKGKLLANGSMASLRENYIPGIPVHIEFLESDADEFLPHLASFPGVTEPARDNEHVLSGMIASKNTIPDLIQHLVNRGARMVSFQINQVSLEEIYFKIQQKASEEA